MIRALIVAEDCRFRERHGVDRRRSLLVVEPLGPPSPRRGPGVFSVTEAARTSPDAAHARSPEWLAARAQDPTFISRYARDFPLREDIGESLVPCLAVGYWEDRIPAQMRVMMENTVPDRIVSFDGLALDRHGVN